MPSILMSLLWLDEATVNHSRIFFLDNLNLVPFLEVCFFYLTRISWGCSRKLQKPKLQGMTSSHSGVMCSVWRTAALLRDSQ